MEELPTVLTATEERGAPYAEKEETKNERKEAVAARR